ncbi:metal ABC transporter solute-binding protein, Zn/Mn family [Halomonas huangheensis]|uniref:Manganese transporter n=1 Tax=Halomonas huangheensis TaxID=1178482 RepID=W1N6Q8_9GAMM|nr:zinc ABC transporter substrate-binding protein [Halomonas huangheensis]ALM51041.1 manganese transporter [Halomonas huangheensis]ERL51208.1 hypothetical protein BJB45_15005 [Halomonas huangheensis]
MRFRLRLITTLMALAFSHSGWADDSAPLKTMVTVGMLSDVVSQVGGDCVATTTMMGPGVDPHLYQASARDVHELNEAELILFSGYSLEGQLGEVLDRFSRIKPAVAVSEQAIDETQLIHSEDAYGVDPHLWMDVGLWAQLVPTVAETLAEERPQCGDGIQTRATAYEAQLKALDEWIRASIVTIPERQRILVTAHDAFNYFGQAYGIEVAGIQGMSTATETGVGDIRRTVDLVVERGVPALFVESTINPRTVQAVIDAASSRGQRVNIGGELYSDAMGAADTADGTYIGMLVANTQHIVTALGGDVVPLPDALQSWAANWQVNLDTAVSSAATN